MFLYLVQHAEANREEEDPTRDLSVKGREDIRKVAQFAGKVQVTINRILHSGKTRALRTAEILAAELKPAQGSAATDGLAPLDDPAIWADRLESLDEDLALVGHLPHLARLASRLLCGVQQPGVINFKMGGMVCLKREAPGRWAVEFILIPALIH
ncbi:MAG: phosphohistidine phosphatase SixA [Syntrophobacterales bacterium]|jgi:phosphohistidine phosphatase|nr:phosphohistidine phosphatase SixA [Syntrophobacterales bacterium]